MTASNSQTRYPEDRLQPKLVPIDLYDNDERRFRATMLHKTLPRVALSVTGERREWEFLNSTYSAAHRDHVAFGATYFVGRRSLRIEAGPAKLSFTQPGFREFNGVIGNVRAAAPIGRRGTVQSALSRDVMFSNYENSSYHVTDAATIAFDWIATRRLSFNFSPTFGRLTYDEPVNGVAREDNYRQFLAGWTYSTTRFRGGFDIVHLTRQSNALIGERSGIRLILRLSLNGNRWFK